MAFQEIRIFCLFFEVSMLSVTSGHLYLFPQTEFSLIFINSLPDQSLHILQVLARMLLLPEAYPDPTFQKPIPTTQMSYGPFHVLLVF